MRQVWLVSCGEYSDYHVVAVCSSYEQACGVAVQDSDTHAEENPVELWEPSDEIPPYEVIYSCLARRGRDSTSPVEVKHGESPMAVDAPMPKPHVRVEARYGWVNAENCATPEEAELMARGAFAEMERVSLR